MTTLRENPAFWLLAATIAVVMAQAGRYFALRRTRA